MARVTACGSSGESAGARAPPPGSAALRSATSVLADAADRVGPLDLRALVGAALS
jgi:hypothetical protein